MHWPGILSDPLTALQIAPETPWPEKPFLSQGRVCVVGAGVSGISAAWLLQTQTQGNVHVTLLDSDPRLGGHAYTMEVLPGVHADLGFQVCLGVSARNDHVTH